MLLLMDNFIKSWSKYADNNKYNNDDNLCLGYFQLVSSSHIGDVVRDREGADQQEDDAHHGTEGREGDGDQRVRAGEGHGCKVAAVREIFPISRIARYYQTPLMVMRVEVKPIGNHLRSLHMDICWEQNPPSKLNMAFRGKPEGQQF